VRVGINGLHLTRGGGGAVRYATELLRAICQTRPDVRLTVFVSRDVPPELREAPWADAVRWVQLPVHAHGRTATAAQLGALAPVAAAHRVRVLHSLAGVGPPRLPSVLASVVTLLDVIWLLVPDQVTMSAAQRASWERTTRLATRTATRVIAISHAAATDIARAYGIDPARIDVTPLGVRAELPAVATPAPELRARFGLGDGRLLLSVGQYQPYKAQDQLIRAVAQLEHRDVVLALAGPPTAFGDELAELAAQLGIADRVRLLGFVGDDDLEGLYAAADAVVQPSRIEGFGLPALEALQRGRPLACSDRSALGEVVGDAALRFDPDDIDAIATAVGRLLDDPRLRSDLELRGPRRAAGFSWETTAAATLESYERALTRRPR